jgi:indole-3-glycerol phosphate synthase
MHKSPASDPIDKLFNATAILKRKYNPNGAHSMSLPTEKKSFKMSFLRKGTELRREMSRDPTEW